MGLDHHKGCSRLKDLLAFLCEHLLHLDQVVGAILQLLVHELERLLLCPAEHLLLVLLALNLPLQPLQLRLPGLYLGQLRSPLSLAGIADVLDLLTLGLDEIVLLRQRLTGALDLRFHLHQCIQFLLLAFPKSSLILCFARQARTLRLGLRCLVCLLLALAFQLLPQTLELLLLSPPCCFLCLMLALQLLPRRVQLCLLLLSLGR
mmetsp:Transcript_11867/g.32525  ORF Transcript_11867/g.32525 Transcript_11867/m.32525 type:complete len:205 (+) Transcript_11867:348-962(+)